MASMYNRDLEFNEGSESNWYQRMNEQDKAAYRKFVSRLNNPSRAIPNYYRGAVKRLNQSFPRANADPSLLTDEQLFEIESYIVQTWYEEQPMNSLLAPCTFTMSKPAFLSKHYKIDEDTVYPEFTAGGPSAFRNIKSFKVGVEPVQSEGIGAAIRFDLSWTLKDQSAGGVYDIENWHQIVGTKRFGVFWDERLCLGSAGQHTSGDLGIKGVFNAASIQSEAIGAGTDNNLATAGDIDVMLYQFAGDMRACKEPGSNVLLTTSGVASEVMLHDSSYTDRTDYERIKKKWFDSGIFSKWVIDDNILAATPAVGTQRAMAFRLSPHVLRRLIIYPFQKKPLSNKEFAEDVAYAFLAADIVKVMNPYGLTYAYYSASANVTTSVAGFIGNGLFMEGGASNVNPSTPPVQPTFY